MKLFDVSGATTFPVDGALREFAFSVSATEETIAVSLEDLCTREQWYTHGLALHEFVTMETLIPQAGAADYAKHIAECLAPSSRDSHATMRSLSRPTDDNSRLLHIGFALLVLSSEVTLEYTITLQAGHIDECDMLRASLKEAEKVIEGLQLENRDLQMKLNVLVQASEEPQERKALKADRQHNAMLAVEGLRERLEAVVAENDTLRAIISEQHSQISTSQVELVAHVIQPEDDDRGYMIPVARPVASLARNPRVFMDIAVNGCQAGRLVFELYAHCVPRTAENFRVLCTGERGVNRSRHALHYKNSKFYECVTSFGCKAGDIVKQNGRGGSSIYGPSFEDESFAVHHDRRGLLSMVNRGPHTNNSNFRISFRAASWLDRKSVVFGHVIAGDAVLDQLESLGTTFGRFKNDEVVTIAHCGEIA